MLQGYDPAAAQDETVLDDVFKFPDIARKIIVHEQAHHLKRQTGNALSCARVKMIDKMINQQRNILPAVGKPGQGQFYDIDAVIQILAKSALGNQA